jgi:hypothetical protein
MSLSRRRRQRMAAAAADGGGGSGGGQSFMSPGPAGDRPLARVVPPSQHEGAGAARRTNHAPEPHEALVGQQIRRLLGQHGHLHPEGMHQNC